MHTIYHISYRISAIQMHIISDSDGIVLNREFLRKKASHVQRCLLFTLTMVREWLCIPVRMCNPVP